MSDGKQEPRAEAEHSRIRDLRLEDSEAVEDCTEAGLEEAISNTKVEDVSEIRWEEVLCIIYGLESGFLV